MDEAPEGRKTPSAGFFRPSGAYRILPIQFPRLTPWAIKIPRLRRLPECLYRFNATGKSGTVCGFAVVGVCRPWVKSLTRSEM
jgi:hypothetical protein